MIASKHLQFVVVFFGCLMALYVGSNIVTLPIPVLCILGAIILLGVWMLIAGQNWWFLIFSCATVGGTLHTGFKLYPTEIGFGLAMIGLGPLVLTQDWKVFHSRRKPLPAIFYITGLYITLRLFIDVVPAVGYRGSLSRTVFDSSWPFFFVFLFHHYGSLEVLPKAIGCMFSVLLVRTLAALVGFFTGLPLVVPGINYYLSVRSEDSLVPMRYVAETLLLSALLLFHCTRSIIYKALLILICAFACALVVMGEGRYATLAMMMLPLAFFAWSRRWLILLIASVLAVGTVAYVNVAPETLYVLPKGAGRALSGLIFARQSVVGDDFLTIGSDHWHEDVRDEGFRRWLESPKNFLFGDGITPSPDLSANMKFSSDEHTAVVNAANIGGYESGLCFTLALFGCVGFGLYFLLFLRFGKDIWRYFIRRPKGTMWEGLLFWGVFASIIWYVNSYFLGGGQGFEMVILFLAWEAVNEGRLDEEPGEAAQPNAYHRLGSADLPIALSPART